MSISIFYPLQLFGSFRLSLVVSLALQLRFQFREVVLVPSLFVLLLGDVSRQLRVLDVVHKPPEAFVVLDQTGDRLPTVVVLGAGVVEKVVVTLVAEVWQTFKLLHLRLDVQKFLASTVRGSKPGWFCHVEANVVAKSR